MIIFSDLRLCVHSFGLMIVLILTDFNLITVNIFFEIVKVLIDNNQIEEGSYPINYLPISAIFNWILFFAHQTKKCGN